MGNFGKNLVFWLAIGMMLAFLFNIFQGAQQQQQAGSTLDTLAYSDFMAEASAGRVTDVTIKGQEIQTPIKSSIGNHDSKTPSGSGIQDTGSRQ